MRISSWFRSVVMRWLGIDRKTAELDKIVAVLLRSETALTERLDTVATLHEDLVRQVGIQQTATAERLGNLHLLQAQSCVLYDKQLTDLRAIVAQQAEQAKQKPATARSMADLRAFMGEE